MTDPKALAEEEARLRELRRTVDLALFYLGTARIDRREAEEIAARVKAKALRLFPDKEETYDLIYQPRFLRIIRRRFGFH
ncbi:MAG: hypothetical protein AB1896_04360 [Thermodesulfobacteriota bacterium]